MQIIDNAIDRSLFGFLQQKILGRFFPWYYGRTDGMKYQEKKEYYKFAWSHIIYENEEWHADNNELFAVLLNSCVTAAGYKIKRLLRIRLVKNCAADSNYVFGPHTDYEFPHKTMLLYFNDSDGDTIIYNEQFSAELDADPDLHKKLTVKQNIQPKANRLVCFDGLHYHSGNTPCTTERRIVLNINYLDESE